MGIADRGTAMKIAALILALLITSAAAPAAVQVGQPVFLQFKALDGTNINTEQLHGKLVVLDFWATWCKPCMAAVPHMVELQQKYAPRGVVVLGISLDDDRQALIRVTREKGMVWPQSFEGGGFENKIAQQFGVHAIPDVFLLGPDGRVLWSGDPGGLEDALTKALMEHPPQLVDRATLATADKTLAQVKQKTEAGDIRGALKLWSKIPAAAALDPDFASRASEVQKKLDAAADSMLVDVQKLIDQKQFVQAVPKLKELSESLRGLPAAARAKKLLSDLGDNAEAKAAIAGAEKTARADEALSAADKLRSQKKDELAYERYKAVAKAFAGTDAAKKAESQIAQYEKDPAFIAKVHADAGASRARAALSMALNYKNAGNVDLARSKYESVIRDFPGTPYAETARRALADLAR